MICDHQRRRHGTQKTRLRMVPPAIENGRFFPGAQAVIAVTAAQRGWRRYGNTQDSSGFPRALGTERNRSEGNADGGDHVVVGDRIPRYRKLIADAEDQIFPGRPEQIHINGLMHCSKSSHRGRVRTYDLFALDLNGNAVVIGGARNDHQVATWDLVLTPHHLADRSDGIHDGRTRRVGHETLQWF
jgi:hypothetical protein